MNNYIHRRREKIREQRQARAEAPERERAAGDAEEGVFVGTKTDRPGQAAPRREYFAKYQGAQKGPFNTQAEAERAYQTMKQ